MRARKVQGLRTTLHTQTTEQAPQVDFDGMFTDIKFFSNLTVAQATVQHDDELLLAFR